MALTTTSFPDERGSTPASDSEYEYIRDEEGRVSLKKIRTVEELKVQEVPETEELKPQPVKKRTRRSRK